MKKFISLLLVMVMALSLIACGNTTKENEAPAAAPAQTQAAAPAQTQAAAPAETEAAKLSGTVATDGSTSMEKVIGALGEAFTEANGNVNFTYNPTGSGSEIGRASCRERV